MSIQWNKEVKMKDIAKFFNQEIDLGDINYNKCLQVSALIVAFGVIPSFTYGTVLGSLDGQRVALMAEVSALQAEVLAAAQSIPQYATAKFISASNVLSFSADAEGQKDIGTFKINYSLTANEGDMYLRRNSVAWGTTTDSTTGKMLAIAFESRKPLSSDTRDSFHIPKGYTREFTLTVDLEATINGYAAIEIRSMKWGTTTSATSSDKVLYVNRKDFSTYRQLLRSNAKVVPPVQQVVSLVSTNARVETNIDNNTNDDEGVFQLKFNVTSPKEGYMRQDVLWGTSTGSTVSLGKVAKVITKDRSNVKDTKDSFFFSEGETRSFLFTLIGTPVKTGVVAVTLNGIKFGSGMYSNASDTVTQLDANKFKTQSILIQHEEKAGPAVLLKKASATVVPGDEKVSDMGFIRYNINITASESDIYIAKETSFEKKGTGFVVGYSDKATMGIYPTRRPTVAMSVDFSVFDTDKAFVIKKGSTRNFDIVVPLQPPQSGEYGLKLFGFNWGTSVGSMTQSYKELGYTTNNVYLKTR